MQSRFPACATLMAIGVSLFALSCDQNGKSNNRVLGDHGRGYFSYVCVRGDADGACSSGGSSSTTASQFPDAIAVGSAFRAEFNPESGQASSAGHATILSASDDFIALDSAAQALVAKTKGKAAIAAKSSIDQKIVDFTVVHIVAIESIRLLAIGDVALPNAILPLNGALNLRAQAFAADRRLAGQLRFTWTVSDPSLVAISPTLGSTGATLTGKKSGSTTLVVTTGETRVELPLVVEGLQ